MSVSEAQRVQVDRAVVAELDRRDAVRHQGTDTQASDRQHHCIVLQQGLCVGVERRAAARAGSAKELVELGRGIRGDVVRAGGLIGRELAVG